MRLNINTTGHQIDAEEIVVPSSSPYVVRLKHHWVKEETPSGIEVWTDSGKLESQLTEEAYDGNPSSGDKFQVDYKGKQDTEPVYKNAILFHSFQAGQTLYVWYKSQGDVYCAEDINAKADKDSDAVAGNLAKFDDAGNPVDSAITAANVSSAVAVKHTQGTDTTLGAMTADINMNSHKIINVTDPTLAQDAATKKYVDDSISGKANMVSNPIEDNLAGLTSTGDLKDIGKKVTDFVQNKNATGTIYLKTVNNTLRYSTDDTNYIIVNTLTDTYGLEWNKTTDSYTRLNDAEGKARSYFDNVYPWAGIRRCILNDSGQIVAYYGESGFVENGSTGQVMVRIPKFYYRAESFTNGYRWYVSPKPQGGFRVHPAFIRNGVEKDCIYFSAYEGCLYDVSASSYITNDAQVADFTAGTGDKLSSIANAKPCSGLTQNLTLPNSRILAHNRGSGWELQDFLTSSAIQLLYLIEYATFNSQAQIGRGVVDKTDDNSTNMAVNTGATSSLGNASGKASGTDGLVSVSYRGIENFWGNIWKWVDGLNIQADGKPWVADHSFASDTFTSPYTYLNGTLATTNGYAKDILFNSSIDCGFLPTVVGGSEDSYLCDYYWQNTGNRVALLGGYWYHGSSAGALCWRLASVSSTRDRTIGARLLYVP